MDLNKVMIIGRLTQDPEMKTIPSGANVTKFGMATNLVWNDQNGQKQERTEFHNIVVWRKLGEICAQYLKKGMKTYIEGRLQTRSWDDPNGVKHYRTEIVADNMIMLSPKGNVSAAPVNEPMPEPPVDNQMNSGSGQNNNEEEINIEDIPF